MASDKFYVKSNSEHKVSFRIYLWLENLIIKQVVDWLANKHGKIYTPLQLLVRVLYAYKLIQQSIITSFKTLTHLYIN